MKRIVMIVTRALFILPAWLIKLSRYKHIDRYSFETRYGWIHNDVIKKVNKKARVTVHSYGTERLPKENGYLLTPNHQGLFDVLALFQSHERPFKAIAKKELENTILVKDVMKMLEFKGMDRSNIRSSVKLIKECAKDMQENHVNYLVFPEGTRCKRQNDMLDFKGGSFKIAMDAKAPIVPVALIDCYKPFDESSIRPVTVQIHYLSPIYYNEYQGMSSNDLAVMVRSRIETCILENKESVL